MPEVQTRLMVAAGTVLGIPANREATRVTFKLSWCSRQHPKRTSSIDSGFIPARSTASFMTALAICLLRESGTPVSDPRIQSAIAWLKREQRESGRWWMQSLYRGNYHYSTYIATAKVMEALALCGEISSLETSPLTIGPTTVWQRR